MYFRVYNLDKLQNTTEYATYEMLLLTELLSVIQTNSRPVPTPHTYTFRLVSEKHSRQAKFQALAVFREAESSGRAFRPI